MSLTSELVRRGHFVYESGHHGDTWLDLDSLISRPALLREVASNLASLLDSYDATLVCGPLEGGAFLAQWVAADLGTAFAYTTRDGLPPTLPVSGQRAIVVDDAINAGLATTATVTALRAADCSVIALASAIVCTPAGLDVGPQLGSRNTSSRKSPPTSGPPANAPNAQFEMMARSNWPRSARSRARSRSATDRGCWTSTPSCSRSALDSAHSPRISVMSFPARMEVGRLSPDNTGTTRGAAFERTLEGRRLAAGGACHAP